MHILYEDNHIIAVNKQVSELVQCDKTGDIPLFDKVKKYIKEKYNKPGEVYLGMVHRLDRPVSGVLLFARTSKALTRLNAMLKQHEIHKKYWALVYNRPPKEEDVLTHYLGRDERKNKAVVYTLAVPDTKKAILKYKVLKHRNNLFLLEVELFTGRHHQIRSQLAHIGCPIQGDFKYGFPKGNNDKSIGLHAREISFMHPIRKERITITAPLPNSVVWKDMV